MSFTNVQSAKANEAEFCDYVRGILRSNLGEGVVTQASEQIDRAIHRALNNDPALVNGDVVDHFVGIAELIVMQSPEAMGIRRTLEQWSGTTNHTANLSRADTDSRRIERIGKDNLLED